MGNTRNRPSTERLLPAVAECLRRHVHAGQRVAVAYSGGMDSSVLLDILQRHRRQWSLHSLQAVHVNHGLNPGAADWVRHCAACCAAMDVPLRSVAVEVNRASGLGLEAAARQARYRVFDELDVDWVLLAHHQDDQAETLLLNLLRGGGVVGAAAMPENRDRYLRPLLDVSRAEIRSYAERHGLAWVEDSSNADDRLRRNFLRNEVIPRLHRLFPAATQNLARAASLFGEAEVLLNQLAQLDYQENGPLLISRLRQLPELRALNVLACHLRRHELQIPARAQLKEAWRQLLEARPDRHPALTIGDIRVCRHRDEIHFVPRLAALPKELIWSGQEHVPWGPGNIRLQAAAGSGVSRRRMFESRVSFRPRLGGENLRLRRGGARRPLKDLLREAGVPTWNRSWLPLMFCDDELVWAAGLGVAVEYLAEPAELGICLEFDQLNW